MPLPSLQLSLCFCFSVAAAVVGCGLRGLAIGGISTAVLLGLGRESPPLGGIGILPRLPALLPVWAVVADFLVDLVRARRAVPLRLFLRKPAAAAKKLWVQMRTESTRGTRGFVCLLLDSGSLVCFAGDMSIGYLAASFSIFLSGPSVHLPQIRDSEMPAVLYC